MVAAAAADPSLASLCRSCFGEQKPQCFHTAAAAGLWPCNQPPWEPWGALATGAGRGVTISQCLSWQKGGTGWAAGLSAGHCHKFLTPNQPGSLSGHLGASSRAAKACDGPRSWGGFGCLPRWQARLSVAEPLRAVPAPAGAGSESRDKRACVLLPAAGPAERPPAQLNRARFPCGRDAGGLTGPLPSPTSPGGPPPCGASPQAPALQQPLPGMNTFPWSPREGIASSLSCWAQLTPYPSISSSLRFPCTSGLTAPTSTGSGVLSIPRHSHSRPGPGQDETWQQPPPRQEHPHGTSRPAGLVSHPLSWLQKSLALTPC